MLKNRREEAAGSGLVWFESQRCSRWRIAGQSSPNRAASSRKHRLDFLGARARQWSISSQGKQGSREPRQCAARAHDELSKKG